MNLKFSRRRRLSNRNRFLACYRQGHRYFTSNFIIFTLCRDQNSYGFCLGTAVSKKIGRAVERNRIKRLLREFFRIHQHELDLDIDIVVVPKRKIQPGILTYWQVERELKPLINKIHRDLSGSSAC